MNAPDVYPAKYTQEWEKNVWINLPCFLSFFPFVYLLTDIFICSLRVPRFSWARSQHRLQKGDEYNVSLYREFEYTGLALIKMSFRLTPQTFWSTLITFPREALLLISSTPAKGVSKRSHNTCFPHSLPSFGQRKLFIRGVNLVPEYLRSARCCHREDVYLGILSLSLTVDLST